MTEIFVETALVGNETYPVTGTVTLTYWQGAIPEVTLSGEQIIQAVPVEFESGDQAEPTGDHRCARWVVETEAGRLTRFTSIPDVEFIDFGDLEDVSPFAFTPTVLQPTVMEYIASLPAVPGPQGPAGPQGAQGVQGVPGEPGATGGSGSAGPKGDKGDTGSTGAQGPQGLEGPTGPQGIQGEPGEDGADGESVTVLYGPDAGLVDVVVPGMFIQTNGTAYVGTEGGWEGPIYLQGPSGANGSDGAPGADGADGADGAPGADGVDAQPGGSIPPSGWGIPTSCLSAGASSALTSGWQTFHPIDVPYACTVDAFIYNLSTAAVGGTFTMTWGLYPSDAYGWIDTTSGPLATVASATTTPAIKTTTLGSPLSLQPGRYWISFLYYVTSAPSTAPLVWACTNHTMQLPRQAGQTFTGVVRGHYISGRTSMGTIAKATLDAGLVALTSNNAPVMSLRIA